MTIHLNISITVTINNDRKREVLDDQSIKDIHDKIKGKIFNLIHQIMTFTLLKEMIRFS